MPKYKYVDGVKYRVVPQSVLGYALVKEDSDNSLPSGGTEGQVLAKASNADYDVEWSTMESGGGDIFLIDAVVGQDESITVSKTVDEILEAVTSNKYVCIRLNYGDTTAENYTYIYVPLVNVGVSSNHGTNLLFDSYDSLLPMQSGTKWEIHNYFIKYTTSEGWAYHEYSGELQASLE